MVYVCVAFAHMFRVDIVKNKETQPKKTTTKKPSRLWFGGDSGSSCCVVTVS